MNGVLFAIILIFTTACTTKIKDFEKYTKAPLLELEEMPTKEEINPPLPRALFIAEKPNITQFPETNAHIVVKNDIENALSNKFITIVERNKNDAIKEEMSIAEFEGKDIPMIQSADYIFEINISDVTFSSNHSLDAMNIGADLLLFAIANNEKNKNNAIYTPHLPKTQYKYTSTIDGSIKIYKIPSMEIAKIIPLKGKAKSSEVASVGSGISVGILNIDTSIPIDAKKDDSNLVHNAIETAIKNAMPEIQNFLNKKGYILSKMMLKNKAIFQINRGIDDGFNPKSKVQIIRQTSEINPLTDEDETFEQNICDGIIKGNVSPKRSWAIFKKDCEGKIHLGDKAIILH